MKRLKIKIEKIFDAMIYYDFFGFIEYIIPDNCCSSELKIQLSMPKLKNEEIFSFLHKKTKGKRRVISTAKNLIIQANNFRIDIDRFLKFDMSHERLKFLYDSSYSQTLRNFVYSILYGIIENLSRKRKQLDAY